MKIYRVNIVFIAVFIFALQIVYGQKKNKNAYRFSPIIQIETTSVKNQSNTGTCWSFATNSFIETELIRMGKESIDLSEMYLIRNTYPKKAINFVQMQGMANFSEGGQAHDDLYAIKNYGLVPESVYPGLWDDNKKHDHEELVSVLTSYLSGVIKKIDRTLSTRWIVGFEGILDAYLGENISEFEYEGKTYTPLTFANDYLQFVPEDYIELTSYSHHPYYSSFILEVPDNWTHDKYYNLPLDEFMTVVNYALANGFSVCWDGDMSERTFSHSKNIAIIPEIDYRDMSEKEKEQLFEKVIPERKIGQEMRQKTFVNFATTDDHLMHLVGTANDQNGTLYYLTKNSWGDSNDLDGNLYMSEAFVKLKTIAIMVHKDAIPEEIRKKLSF